MNATNGSYCTCISGTATTTTTSTTSGGNGGPGATTTTGGVVTTTSGAASTTTSTSATTTTTTPGACLPLTDCNGNTQTNGSICDNGCRFEDCLTGVWIPSGSCDGTCPPLCPGSVTTTTNSGATTTSSSVTTTTINPVPATCLSATCSGDGLTGTWTFSNPPGAINYSVWELTPTFGTLQVVSQGTTMMTHPTTVGTTYTSELWTQYPTSIYPPNGGWFVTPSLCPSMTCGPSGPVMAVSPIILTFNAYPGDTLLTSQFIQVRNDSTTTPLTWTILPYTAQGWLTPAPAPTTLTLAPGQITNVTVNVNATGYPVGNHSVILTFHDTVSSASDPDQTVTINFSVLTPSVISVSPPTTDFGSSTFGTTTPIDRSITVWNSQPGTTMNTVNWTYSDPTWLSATPISIATPLVGTNTQPASNIVLHANPSVLSVGTHSATISFTSNPPSQNNNAVLETVTITIIGTTPTIDVVCSPADATCANNTPTPHDSRITLQSREGRLVSPVTHMIKICNTLGGTAGVADLSSWTLNKTTTSSWFMGNGLSAGVVATSASFGGPLTVNTCSTDIPVSADNLHTIPAGILAQGSYPELLTVNGTGGSGTPAAHYANMALTITAPPCTGTTPDKMCGTVTPTVSGTIVELHKDDGSYWKSSTTDNAGDYLFAGLTPGNTYFVTPAVGRGQGVSNLQLLDYAPQSGMDFTITGIPSPVTVTDTSGAFVVLTTFTYAGATPPLSTAGSMASYSGTIGSAGKVTISVPSGKPYFLTCWKPDTTPHSRALLNPNISLVGNTAYPTQTAITCQSSGQ